MGINLDHNGVYLGCTGNDYRRVQRAVRKWRKTQETQRRQKATGKRKREVKLLTEQVMTAEQVASESKRREHQAKQERDHAMCEVKLLTERVTAAERLASERKRGEQQAIKKRNSMDKKLEASKKLVSDLRVAREQCRNYPVVVQERGKALQQVAILTERVTQERAKAMQQVAILTERVTAAERLASERKRGEQQAQRKMESMVQVLPDEKRKFATHTWLSVARILGIDGTDLSRIVKASKHMHDTVSSDWNESLARHSEMIIRLRSAGRIILTRLFSCVRVKKTTVPVNEVLGVICSEDENYSNGNDKTLQEIRKAVHSAIAERRISDAKMLLTLSIASFSGNENGTGKCIESMKRYFTSIKPIVIGSKVTFLTPDESPIKSKKKIKCHNYSYHSKFVTRGTAVAVNHRKNELKVRHYVPGVEKDVVSKVSMQQAINSANIYVNRKLLVSAMQWRKHLGVGVSPVQTPSVQNHVITLKVT